eukprot:Pgem_evm1s19730
MPSIFSPISKSKFGICVTYTSKGIHLLKIHTHLLLVIILPNIAFTHTFLQINNQTM